MKNKLQALITEQKALAAKFEELVYSTTEESSTLDFKKVYIKGHPTRGAEVIKMLEDLGGVNRHLFWGNASDIGYYIAEDGTIDEYSLDNFSDYTELHLPEEVSAENAQTTNIKVGDWIWVDNITTSNTIDYDIRKIVHHNPHKVVEVNKDGDICFDVAGEIMFINPFEGDKFHKVDLPSEEVELIEGEVYVCIKGKIELPFIYNGKNDNEIKYLVGLDFKGHLNYSYQLDTIRHKYKYRLATSEQRKQFFDALKKAGKHFDKENMRLLDVEEWSCERGLPIIVRNETSNWRADIYHSYDAVDVKYPFLCAISGNEGRPYKYAIPYTEENLKIIGTTDSPDKHYKFVSE